MDERLEQVETRIAYLEQANAELSATVFRQQQELDELRMRISDMRARIAASQAPATAWTAEQEKPPHY